MMNTHSKLTFALSLALASAGCSDATQVDTEADAGPCAPSATLPPATCAEGVLARSGEVIDLSAGAATVLRLEVDADGRASLALEVGTTVTTLSLPAAPMVEVGDTLTVERDPFGATILRSEGDLVAYLGPQRLVDDGAPGGPGIPVDRASLLEANREGTPLSTEVAGVPLTLEAACGGYVQHQGSSYGCVDVPLVAFSVRHGETTVAPGASAIAPLEDGLALAIENRSIHVRETTACECADLWPVGFELTLVVTAAE